MPPFSSPHSVFTAPGPGRSLRRSASQKPYCYLFPTLAQDDNVGLFAGTTPEQTFSRLAGFEKSSRLALGGLPVLPMRLPAIYTYFGQFVNHDISAPAGDVVKRPSRPRPAGIVVSGDLDGLDRTERSAVEVILGSFFNEQANPLSLDSLYGDAMGPGSADPEIAALYDDDSKRFRLGVTRREDDQLFRDLGKNPLRVVHARGARDIPRRDRTPLIADRRNDENLLISQLHLALMLFHNKAVAALEERLGTQAVGFDDARRLVTLHYHWLILHDYLANLLSPAVLATPLADRPQRLPAPGVVPLEFTTAAFRFGHSMVGEAYDYNTNFGRGRRLAPKATLDDLFDFTTHQNMRHPGIAETLQLPDHWVIDWDRMSRPARPGAVGGAEQIDINFAQKMLNGMGASEVAVHGSILFRNLMRGYHRRIPFGQALAKASGLAALEEAEISAVLPAGGAANPAARDLREIARDHGFLRETPAWLYFLAEARHHEQGQRVGPTASAIIADTIVGLMRFMGSGVLNGTGGRWHPGKSDLKAPGGRALTTIGALLRFAVKDTALPDTDA